MRLPEVGQGLAFGVGGTNYRVALCDAEGIVGRMDRVATPSTPDEFFAQTGRLLLNAAYNQQAEWGLLGVPGPVSVVVDHEDNVSQNLRVTNIPALSRKEGFDPIAEMIKADPAVEDLLDSGFVFLSANDGELGVQAAAKLYGKGYQAVANVIDGTGNGGGLTRKDHRFPGQEPVYHPDPGLWEIGHPPFTIAFPSRTPELTFSGIGYAHLEQAIQDLEPDDPVFDEIGTGIAEQIIRFGVLGGAELVVVSGGIGIGSQNSYGDDMMRMLDRFRRSRNPMADKVPDVIIPPKSKINTYELHGARATLLSHLTRRAIDQLVLRADSEPSGPDEIIQTMIHLPI